jgi:hypothetical protein
MKHVVISLILFGICPIQAVFYSSSVRSITEKNAKKNNNGVVHFNTVAALHVYNDCIHGAAGDFKETGCKSEHCWRTCEAIARTADTAKKENIYQQYATCVFGDNTLRNGRWGKLGRDGCHIRRKRCWHQCLAEAREKVAKGISVHSYPYPELPPVPEPKPVHKKAVVDTVTKISDKPQTTPASPTTTTRGLFWGGKS